ncbi:hypothetical protein ACOMHN_029688 [Nucella lapillus]
MKLLCCVGLAVILLTMMTMMVEESEAKWTFLNISCRKLCRKKNFKWGQRADRPGYCACYNSMPVQVYIRQ